MHRLTMLSLKAVMMNHTAHGKPIPKEALEALKQEIPMFNMTPSEKGKQRPSEYPPNPMFLRLGNILKAQIVEDMFLKVEEQKRVEKTIRGYVR